MNAPASFAKEHRLTRAECAELSGRSISWLRRHQCGLCEQTCLRALQYGCASIFGPKCDPRAKSYGPEARAK